MLERNELAQTFAKHAVADLIVVLSEDDEFHRRDFARRVPMPALPIYRIPAGVDEAFSKSLGHMLEAAEIDVIALALFGQQCMKRVMEVIVPLGVEPVASELRMPDETSIIQGAFGNGVDAPVQLRP